MMKVHSHGFREDRIAQAKYELAEQLKTAVNLNPKQLENLIASWLLANTTLNSRTRKDYQETIKPQLAKMLKISI
jgi:hypothetical protein